MHAIFLLMVIASNAQPTFDDAVQTSLKDVSFSVEVLSSNRYELQKINRDFALGYEAEEVAVQYKDPLMIRVTFLVNGQRSIYIVNGFTRSFRIPRMRVNIEGEDISKSPGKHQTLLDFGVITSGMRDLFLSGEYVRNESSGELVFDVRYKYSGDKSRHRIWVDADKRYIVKREWYNQDGDLKATFIYELPAQSDKAWMPTKLTVINADGKIAGISRLTKVEINAGIPDSVFKL